ncbi:MAG TPA: transposase [Roseiflexaceae bacterium]|nr:transposase [Roseiflexaceae bacterium]
MTITRAITHIPIRLDIKLDAANKDKLARLDELAVVYKELCQAYTTAFCTAVKPDAYADVWIDTRLSARWQRVAIQHAAGIAQSWRSNRARAYRDYQEHAVWHAQQEEPKHPPPVWKEWNTPVLKQTVLQANANVAALLPPPREQPATEQSGTEQSGTEQADTAPIALEPAKGTTFDYWLRISTLERGKPILIPITLVDYHRQALAGQRINTSMTLARKASGWWLTLTVDEHVAPTTTEESPVVGVDVGIANFLTTSDGRRYGTFHGKLARRHQLDREKRQRKAKLRACLKKKGVIRLPSVANKRLGRHVRQEINRAVNQFYADYPGYQIAYEDLNVAGMRFHAKRMNAYLYSSNLGHIPKQLAWAAEKRGQAARAVWAAYSSQCCSRCYYVSRDNRKVQETFSCQACGFRCHADENAAINLQARFHDHELQACRSREKVKALLNQRHKECFNGCP